MKNQRLEQNEKRLEKSNRFAVDLTTWKQAKAATELHNILNPKQKTSIYDTYNAFVEFDGKNADMNSKGVANGNSR